MASCVTITEKKLRAFFCRAHMQYEFWLDYKLVHSVPLEGKIGGRDGKEASTS